MLQDLSAGVFFPPCSQHRTLGVYLTARKSGGFKGNLLVGVKIFKIVLCVIMHVMVVEV